MLTVTCLTVYSFEKSYPFGLNMPAVSVLANLDPPADAEDFGCGAIFLLVGRCLTFPE